jgi:hypothetical protein
MLLTLAGIMMGREDDLLSLEGGVLVTPIFHIRTLRGHVWRSSYRAISIILRIGLYFLTQQDALPHAKRHRRGFGKVAKHAVDDRDKVIQLLTTPHSSNERLLRGCYLPKHAIGKIQHHFLMLDLLLLCS